MQQVNSVLFLMLQPGGVWIILMKNEMDLYLFSWQWERTDIKLRLIYCSLDNPSLLVSLQNSNSHNSCLFQRAVQVQNRHS